MIDYKNTMAMLVFFGLTAAFADAMLLSKLRRAGSFLGLKTGSWIALYTAASTAFMGLTMIHLAYRKDRIIFIKELMKHKEVWR